MESVRVRGGSCRGSDLGRDALGSAATAGGSAALSCPKPAVWHSAWDYASDVNGDIHGGSTPRAVIKELAAIPGFESSERIAAMSSETGPDRSEIATSPDGRSATAVIYVHDEPVLAYDMSIQPDGWWIIDDAEACG